MKHISWLNGIFVIEIVLFFLIIFGVVPRWFSFGLAGTLAVYALAASLENAAILFVRSIPLFIALPITASFDNLNAWRTLSVIIFLKWCFVQKAELLAGARQFLKTPMDYLRRRPVSVVLSVLLLLALISVIPAPDKAAALKRIVYFVNLSFIGIVLYDFISKTGEFRKRVIANIAIPLVLVTVFGFFQLILTYFIDVYQFMRVFGEEIQCRQFGEQWCYIAVHSGNTWLAYYGEQLSLRMFSLFPDSHSFPIFLLLGLPSLFALKTAFLRWKTLLYWAAIIFVYLGAILSGTRGIWAAGIGTALLGCAVLAYTARIKLKTGLRVYYRHIFATLAIFFVLFGVAYPIAYSPQFLMAKGDRALLRKRIKSIIDFGETSNAQRIAIWKASLRSIAARPFAGVGIGNFPVVLNQKIQLAKAGSTAHNLYLHIPAEMGVAALCAAMLFLYMLIRRTYMRFRDSADAYLSFYFGAMLLFLPWVFLYLLTDVALFDERAFLLFSAVCAIILSGETAKSGVQLFHRSNYRSN